MRKRHMVAGSDSSVGTFEDEYEKAEKWIRLELASTGREKFRPSFGFLSMKLSLSGLTFEKPQPEKKIWEVQFNFFCF